MLGFAQLFADVMRPFQKYFEESVLFIIDVFSHLDKVEDYKQQHCIGNKNGA
jgi:hypothetical protein